MASKTLPKVGDIVGYHCHSVVVRALLPLMVTSVNEMGLVSGVAYSATPENHGWPYPVKAVQNVQEGTSHNTWQKSADGVQEPSKFVKSSRAASKVKPKGKPDLEKELNG